MKKKRVYIYLTVSLILFAIALYVYYIAKDYLGIHKSEFLGNTSFVINLLKKTEGKIPFSFAFVSDTENSDISEWLIKTLLKEKIDFLVLIGDFVNNSVLPEHKLFMQRISSYNPKVPIFLVPSNHDISGKKDNAGQFTSDDFQENYGPLNFSFIYNKSLFIFISNIKQDDNICRDYLEKVLTEREKDIKYTFLFCPTPFRKILNRVFDMSYWISDLDKLLERYRVDYVISGDYHRHYELTGNNFIQYIASGSGGSHFHGKDLFGRFRNATKMTVYQDGVSKEILVYNKWIHLTDNSIKRFLYNKFMPFVESHCWLFNWVISLFIFNVLFSLYCFIKSIKV